MLRATHQGTRCGTTKSASRREALENSESWTRYAGTARARDRLDVECPQHPWKLYHDRGTRQRQSHGLARAICSEARLATERAFELDWGVCCVDRGVLLPVRLGTESLQGVRSRRPFLFRACRRRLYRNRARRSRVRWHLRLYAMPFINTRPCRA
jgi:hypothetical protein